MEFCRAPFGVSTSLIEHDHLFYGVAMEILFLILGAVVLFVVIRIYFNATATPDDPKPMSNQHLLAAIAGQADWLEKMSRAPIESQLSRSIVELSAKRKNYMACLCLEILSRDSSDGQTPYPGATTVLNIFGDAAQYAKTLEESGLSKNNAAVRAVKEKLFRENGVIYPAQWET